MHYWSDHEYGGSEATVRVHIYGTLRFEESAALVNLDLWDVATIAWPSAKVTAMPSSDGGVKITHAYQNPYFYHP